MARTKQASSTPSSNPTARAARKAGKVAVVAPAALLAPAAAPAPAEPLLPAPAPTTPPPAPYVAPTLTTPEQQAAEAAALEREAAAAPAVADPTASLAAKRKGVAKVPASSFSLADVVTRIAPASPRKPDTDAAYNWQYYVVGRPLAECAKLADAARKAAGLGACARLDTGWFRADIARGFIEVAPASAPAGVPRQQ